MIIVMKMEPVWGTAESVIALYGIPRQRLLSLARAGTIRARKMEPDSRSASIVFRLQDVREWLEHEAPTPCVEPFADGRTADAAG